MLYLLKKYRLLIFAVILICVSGLWADDSVIATIIVEESSGIQRDLEYIECNIQVSIENLDNSPPKFIIEEIPSGLPVPCQIFELTKEISKDKIFFKLIFPLSIGASEKNEYLLKQATSTISINSDLRLEGSGFDLIVENRFYRADLSKSDLAEPKNHDSGQIRELLIKMGINQLLTNVEDRLHWAPNFKRPDLEWYTTIAHWNSPAVYNLHKGPYLIKTVRKDLAPDHPEISLTAVYRFYEDLPYFKFYSEMQMVEDVWLELLRNDEMTMDSMFTHLAFQRSSGKIVDITFSERKELLEKQPIQNESPWICFYNREKKYAFGSIRIQYSNLNQFGEPSPVYQPQTQIGEWLAGIKYWNRRLIHNQLTFVPRGSRYMEENAYLVFKMGNEDKFEVIKYWVDRLHHPLEVEVRYH